jgi:hypothetical protein
MRPLALFALLLLLAACDGPRQEMTPKDQALHETRPLRLRVVKVYDNLSLDYTREFHVSHVIDVDVLDAPEGFTATQLTLPYDQYYVAKPPPRAGEVVTVAPADWLKQAIPGKTRGFGE